MLLKPGEILHQRYRLAGLLAQGGFGAVYRAWDLALGRTCAVKENLDTSADAQKQFEREARILASLSHANLPRVTDHFFISGQGQYLVMDLVEGQDLQAMLEERGLPLDETQTLRWISQVCDALSYLHSQQPPVIHRDIKPANIRVTPGGRAMLVDFGIAKVYDPKLKTTLGARAVTPGYSPHEQYGQGTTDPRTDIYALGATLYTLLSGVEPPESIQRVVRDPLIPVNRVNPAISENTARAIQKAMQVDAEQRFQSAADFKDALEPPRLLPHTGPAAPSSAMAQPIRQPLRRPWIWVAGLAITAVAFVFLGLVLSGSFSGKESARQAESLVTASALPATTMPPAATTLAVVETITLVPSDTPTPTLPPWIYTVQKGDTCSELAQRFEVSMREIVRLNNLDDDCNQLFAEQRLLIPASAVLLTPGALTPQVTVSPNATRVSDLDGAAQVYIPAGLFLMGSAEEDANAQRDEKPQRTVHLDTFWIDRLEVTTKMYARCVQAGVCREPAQRSSKTRLFYYGDERFDAYPVINVSWQDASTYCQWVGRRLPSEAEWEKAARGSDGRSFPWGDEPPTSSLLNFNNRVGDTTAAGSYPSGASPYGVLDMAGNVAEWVADWYSADYYAIGLVFNPHGPAKGEFRVLRGGSWFSSERSARAAFRLWYLPDLGYDSSGFRCAAD